MFCLFLQMPYKITRNVIVVAPLEANWIDEYYCTMKCTLAISVSTKKRLYMITVLKIVCFVQSDETNGKSKIEMKTLNLFAVAFDSYYILQKETSR
jgi:hypothetical protein